MTKVCHVTDTHQSTDTRIFIRECTSLAKAGYEVWLVAKGESREENGVHVAGVGESPVSRLKRWREFSRSVYEKALSLDCEIYHLHDPGLLPWGLKLKKAGKKVIFDSHEDVPAQTMGKDYIPKYLRRIVGSSYHIYETYVTRRIDGVVGATPYIAQGFKGRARRVIDINNYVSLDDIHFQDRDFTEREAIVCYVGGISRDRGEYVMREAMKGVDGVCVIAGLDGDKNDVPKNIIYTGQLDRAGVNSLLGKSVAGLCVVLPTPAYLEGKATKIFEYMAAGLPFICSDFHLLRELVEETHAGICVNPNDVNAVRKAIVRLLNDRKLAQEMGLNGRRAVETKYSWANEAERLIEFYREIEESKP